MDSPPPTPGLLEREARFWDEQQQAIETLYARPHDWRFVPALAERIVGPKQRYISRLLERHRGEIRTILDVGCGNGWFCHAAAERGFRVFGVDVSPRKIEVARRQAEARGVAHLCTFEAVDALAAELPGQVDLLTSFGSLHHFPDLERLLPRLVGKHLRPGGYMLFCEPHHEAMPPGLYEFFARWSRHPRFGRLLDTELYEEVSNGALAQAERQRAEADDDVPGDATGPAHPASETFNVRGESPAGLEFFGEEPDMRAILTSRYELVRERYAHYAAGHLTNAFVIYMKSPLVRGLYRAVLPLVVAVDDLLCRRPSRARYAEEGIWFLRNEPPRAR